VRYNSRQGAVHRVVPALIVLAALVCTFFEAGVPLGERNHTVFDDEGILPAVLDSAVQSFIRNAGQVSDGVRFYSIGNPAVAFRDDGVMFVVRARGNQTLGGDELHHDSVFRTAFVDEHGARSAFAYLIRFPGANLVTPVGTQRLAFDSNFFLGNDATKWRTQVPSYGEVVYRNLYDGIDLVYRGLCDIVNYE